MLHRSIRVTDEVACNLPNQRTLVDPVPPCDRLYAPPYPTHQTPSPRTICRLWFGAQPRYLFRFRPRNRSWRETFCSGGKRTEAPMDRERYFIEPGNGQWHLVREYDDAPMASFRTKREAIEHGRETARTRGNSQLIIKDRNHVIQTEWTYGHDPRRQTG